MDHVMDTASGRQLDLDRPMADQIVLEDIAGALSRICRFSAQTQRFYSVAQHAVYVSRLLVDGGRRDLALAALHHDSHEAYVGDLPAPLKRKLRDEGSHAYQELCDALDEVIARALGVQFPAEGSEDRRQIKQADTTALLVEARALLHDGGHRLLSGTPDATERMRAAPGLGRLLPPAQAATAFLAAHVRLAS
jgi:hypothetical protein